MLPDGIPGEFERGATDGTETGRHHGQEEVTIVLWDERLSTWDAERLLPDESPRKKLQRRKRHSLDAHAATVILQSYLDSLPRGESRANDSNPGVGEADPS